MIECENLHAQQVVIGQSAKSSMRPRTDQYNIIPSKVAAYWCSRTNLDSCVGKLGNPQPGPRRATWEETTGMLARQATYVQQRICPPRGR